MIGDNIRKLREALGRTQKEFAEIIGTDESLLCRWETGDRPPNGESIQKILDATGVNPKVLYEGPKKRAVEKVNAES